MKLASDSETLAENKALILYILDKVAKPISNTALLKLVTSINDMNYFYFQQFLLDLIENKYIINYPQDSETIYELTSQGKEALTLVKDLIPGFQKFKVDNNFKDNLHQIENELSVTADFFPHSETDYTVVCKLVENNHTLFEVQTFANSVEQAKIISDNWTNNADQIYPEILEILTTTNNNKTPSA